MNEIKVGDTVLIESPMREGIILRIVISRIQKFYKVRCKRWIFSRDEWCSEYYIKGVIQP